MDIAYKYVFTDEVLACVIDLLPLKCDTYDGETIITWMYNVETNKKDVFLKYITQILTCYANWFGNDHSLSEDYIVCEILDSM